MAIARAVPTDVPTDTDARAAEEVNAGERAVQQVEVGPTSPVLEIGCTPVVPTPTLGGAPRASPTDLDDGCDGEHGRADQDKGPLDLAPASSADEATEHQPLSPSPPTGSSPCSITEPDTDTEEPDDAATPWEQAMAIISRRSAHVERLAVTPEIVRPGWTWSGRWDAPCVEPMLSWLPKINVTHETASMLYTPPRPAGAATSGQTGHARDNAYDDAYVYASHAQLPSAQPPAFPPTTEGSLGSAPIEPVAGALMNCTASSSVTTAKIFLWDSPCSRVAAHALRSSIGRRQVVGRQSSASEESRAKLCISNDDEPSA